MLDWVQVGVAEVVVVQIGTLPLPAEHGQLVMAERHSRLHHLNILVVLEEVGPGSAWVELEVASF
jgi:hypothetical protein